MSRLRPTALMGLALCCALLAPQAASAATLPPQGVYESCSPGSSATTLAPCVERLQEIRDGGFTVVLNYGALYGAPAQVRAYADAAAARGIRLIWPLHHPNLRRQTDVSATFRQMATACGCSSPQQLVPYMVGVVKELPATWMYYVGDEVPLAEHDAVKAVAELVRAADAAHDRFFVHYGSGSNLAPFADIAELLGDDFYPLFPDRGSAADVAGAALGTKQVADGAGKPMAMVLQAFSWGPSYQPVAPRWPTVAEYAAMRDVTLDNSSPRVVLWWAYYVIKREADPQLHWQELVAGAMAPWSGPRAAPQPALTETLATGLAPWPAPAPERDAVPEVRVRTLSATVRRRVSDVRFSLTAATRARISVRCAGRRVGGRTAKGSTKARKVRVTMRSRRGACRVTVAPAGGRARTVRAKTRR